MVRSGLVFLIDSRTRESSRRPLGMTRQQPIDDADLVSEKAAKSNAKEPRGDCQSLAETGKPFSRIGDRHGNGRGDQHHPGNSAKSKDE